MAVVQLLLLNNADISICDEVCYSNYNYGVISLTCVQFHIITEVHFYNNDNSVQSTM